VPTGGILAFADSIYIKTDLEDGEEVIVSPLSGAAQGMKLRKSTK